MEGKRIDQNLEKGAKERVSKRDREGDFGTSEGEIVRPPQCRAGMYCELCMLINN